MVRLMVDFRGDLARGLKYTVASDVINPVLILLQILN